MPLDVRVIAFTFIAAVISAVIVGIGPARRATEVDVTAVLQRGAGGSSGRVRGDRAMVVLQAALCVALVLAAALTVRNLLGLVLRPNGFDPQNLYELSVEHGHPTAPGAPKYYDVERVRGVLDVVRHAEGVAAAGAATFMPVGYSTGDDPFWQSRQRHGGEWGIGAGFFSILQTPMRAGREFTELEVDTKALVAIVSESGARDLWPGELSGTAVGRAITTEDGPRTVVGVVADIRPLPGVGTVPALYVPVTAKDVPIRQSALTIALRLTPGARFDQVSLQRQLDAQFGRSPMRTSQVEAKLAPRLEAPRFQAVLFGAVALIALLLTSAGLYALTAFESARRRQEMGVRLALGATASDLKNLVVGAALRPVAIGAVAGLLVGWWAATLLRAFLFEVDVHDPWTFGLVVLVLFVASGLAAWLPAKRAARTDPVAVLRAQ
jgi:hypothetical protein